jgi:hypothetical protein
MTVARLAARGPEADLDAEVLGLLRDRRGRGRGLPPSLRRRLERCFGADLAGVRLHADDIALTGRLGVLGLAHGDDVYVHPDLDPSNPAGFWVLAHEVAHTLQQRGSRDGRDRPAFGRADDPLESEATRAALAALAGRPFRVRPRCDCSEVQPFLPLLIVLVAAGIALWPKDLATDPGEAPVPHLYETGWGFVPFVGSLDQAINGKNWWNQAAGSVFFLLDVSMVAPIVRGALFSVKPGVQAALAAVSRGGGTAAQRAALTRLVAKEGAQFMSEEAATQLVREAGLGQTMLFVGAQSGKEGIHHSVVYALVDGKVYKLHGGILKLAAKVQGRSVEKVVGEAWLRRFNTMTVYREADLLAAGLTDEALTKVIGGWADRSSGLVEAIVNSPLCSARGCAFSQALLLEQLGLHSAPTSSRYLPLLLERSRMAGELGTHYIINPGSAVRGTLIQLGTGVGAGAGYGVARFAAGVGERSVIDLIRRHSGQASQGAPGVVLASLADDISLDTEDESLFLEDEFTVGIPMACTPDDPDGLGVAGLLGPTRTQSARFRRPGGLGH